MPETRGRKVNKEFDIDLLSQLIYVSAAQAEGQPGTTTMHVNTNAMFSYGVIRAQAQRLQQEARWVQEKDVQQMKFGNFMMRGSKGF